MKPGTTEILATCLFTLAILHTFLVAKFQHLAHRFPEGSVGENLFHLLGEVEVVFGLWAGAFLAGFALIEGRANAISYLEGRNFTEPLFVFAIMVVCATKPILNTAEFAIDQLSRILPLPGPIAHYLTLLTIGPVLGSFITEPAAMTVTALILFDRFYRHKISNSLAYATLGLLFVNISIGGVLTPYAAPPVLMVAGQWNWDVTFMISNFGWKGVLASCVSTALVAFRFRKQISAVPWEHRAQRLMAPLWVHAFHLLFLLAIVATAHHPTVFFGIFLFFLGLVKVTSEYQTELKLREGLLVGFFLGGLVIFGGLQRWWLEPLLSSMSTLTLYFGAIGLTAITDNAALTYLGSQVPTLSEASRYALVAGAVVGGGLTVIANAPNPAGFGILNPAFGPDGIHPLKLFKAALIPTLISALLFL